MNPIDHSSWEQLESYPLHYFDAASQLKSHVYRRLDEAAARGDASRASLRDTAELSLRQKEIRNAFLSGIGGIPETTDPLNARTTGLLEGATHRVEKIIFSPRRGVHATASLYVPKGLQSGEERGAVLFLCGHHLTARLHPEYQNVCLTLVAAGLVVLALDPIGQGERLSYHDPVTGTDPVGGVVFDHDQCGFPCRVLGQSLARYFLHDAMRGLDYLAARPEVDASRIGVTGNSGGGCQTAMMMMADSRVAAAAPATFIPDYHSGTACDAEQSWHGFAAPGWTFADILISFAPKPLCILATTYDTFPIEAARTCVSRARIGWDLHGRTDDLVLIEDQAEHRYTQKLADTAARFFSRHLLNGATPNTPPEQVHPEQELQCTRSGQIKGDFPDAQSPVDHNQSRLAELKAARPPFRDGMGWLQRQVGAHRQPCDLNLRVYGDLQMGELRMQRGLWWSQPDLLNAGCLFRPIDSDRAVLPVTIALWDNGSHALSLHREWIAGETAHGRAVLVVDVTGGGLVSPHPTNPQPIRAPFGTIHKLADDLFTLGDSLAALRIHDVLRSIEVLDSWPGLDPAACRLYGSGREGLYAAAAAQLDARVKSFTATNLGAMEDCITHPLYDPENRRAVELPGALAFFDVPDLAAAWCSSTTLSS